MAFGIVNAIFSDCYLRKFEQRVVGAFAVCVFKCRCGSGIVIACHKTFATHIVNHGILGLRCGRGVERFGRFRESTAAYHLLYLLHRLAAFWRSLWRGVGGQSCSSGQSYGGYIFINRFHLSEMVDFYRYCFVSNYKDMKIPPQCQYPTPGN